MVYMVWTSTIFLLVAALKNVKGENASENSKVYIIDLTSDLTIKNIIGQYLKIKRKTQDGTDQAPG
jgi:hypothetical protein